MSEVRPTPPAAPNRARPGLKVALVGAGLAAGVIGATAFAASAQTTAGSAKSTSPNSSSTASTGPTGPRDRTGFAPGQAPANRHGAAPVRNDEKALSASMTGTLKAAALKAVPGGTVYRVESDAGDGTYEAHMTKADRTEVTVKFDKNLKVTKVEAGMGTGDPAPRH